MAKQYSKHVKTEIDGNELRLLFRNERIDRLSSHSSSNLSALTSNVPKLPSPLVSLRDNLSQKQIQRYIN